MYYRYRLLLVLQMAEPKTDPSSCRHLFENIWTSSLNFFGLRVLCDMKVIVSDVQSTPILSQVQKAYCMMPLINFSLDVSSACAEGNPGCCSRGGQKKEEIGEIEAIAKGPSCNTFQLPPQASIASSFGIALGNVQSKGTSNRSAVVPCFEEPGHQCPIDLKSCDIFKSQLLCEIILVLV